MKDAMLEIVEGSNRRTMPLEERPLTVGRHADNMLVLADDLSSRFHCVIEPSPQGPRLRDLDSRNGTFVNGKPVKTAVLHGGDVVRIGRTELRLVLPGGAPAASAVDDDMLDLDLLEEIVGAEPVPEPSPIIKEAEDDIKIHFNTEDPEQALIQQAAALPDREFTEQQIALVNARGHLAHPAGARKGAEQPAQPIRILRLILLVCFRIRATDIHIEPKSEGYQVRLRVDGGMVDLIRLPNELGVRVAAVVKVLCELDMGQRNVVQEGHFSAALTGRRVDYRVSFAPAMFGQKLVIRILDTANAPLYIWDLRMPDWMQREIEKAVQGDSGMVLVCGPTGSGKTTTLYAVVRSIDTGERNVVTIEDPVEIQLEGVTQIPVNEPQGNTFSALLKSVLRQDPDAILVGEVRDPETAKIAMQAAMTGHLVFSTVHARDTVSTIFRLLDLGVEPFLVASGLHQVVAQRLVRQLCPYCKTAHRPTDEERQKLGPLADGLDRIFSPGKCHRCLNTGYAGRRALFELLTVNETLRDVILRSPTMVDIQQALTQTRFVRLRDIGYKLVAEGLTSLDEIDRVAG